MSLSAIRLIGNVARLPIFLLEALLRPFDEPLARRREGRLGQDIHDAMSFLFDNYNAQIVPNRGVPFPPMSDYAFVSVAVEDVLIRFCRGRGELDVRVALKGNQEEWHDLRLLLSVLEQNDGVRRQSYVDLWRVASLLQPALEGLIRSADASDGHDLKRRLEEVYVGDRIAMIRSGMRNRVTTSSDEQTIELGRLIAKSLPKKACVLLIGNLGAGKTTLAKGIIDGLGFATPEEVVSPTFTLIHEYGDGRAYHIDLYRLDKPEQVATLGLEDIFDREAVVLIEWGERFPSLMPPSRMEIRLSAMAADERQIEILNTL